MTSLASLITNKEVLKGIYAPFWQLGVKNTLKALLNARNSSRAQGDQLIRHFYPQYWQLLGTREAIIDGDNRITYGDYKTRVLRLANVFDDLGLLPGDSTAILLGNGSAWFEIVSATAIMGLKMPMINWHLNESELVECIDLSKAKALIVDETYLPKIIKVKEQFANIKHIIVVRESTSNDALKPSEGLLDYHELMAKVQKNELPAGELVFSPTPFSGGTTGTPKFLSNDPESSRQSDLFNGKGPTETEKKKFKLMFACLLHYLGLGTIRDPISNNIRCLIAGPLYHSGGLTGVIPFFLGGTVVPMKKFDAEEWLSLIEKERISWAFVAPTMLERVLRLDDDIKKKYDLSSMQSLLCAAAPCAPEVKEQINKLFLQQGNKRSVFHEFYGSSETSAVSILVPSDYESNPERYKSVGKVRGSECKIYDEDTKTWAKSGTVGKVVARTARVYQLQYEGYSEAEMLKTFVEVDGQYWYDDGLMGYLDDDDFLYLTSRIKEMIISGGVNIYPNEIEEVFKRHESVMDAAVVGAPDADLGEVAALVVQPVPGKTPNIESLISFGKNNGLYGFKLPKHVQVLEDFPRDSAGKLKKKQLEELFETDEAVSAG